MDGALRPGGNVALSVAAAGGGYIGQNAGDFLAGAQIQSRLAKICVLCVSARPDGAVAPHLAGGRVRDGHSLVLVLRR